MYYLKKKDVKNRSLFYKKERLRIIFKYIHFNLVSQFRLKRRSIKFNKILTVWYRLCNKDLSRLNSKTRLVRRCNISNRNRANFRLFGGLSRIVVRDFIHSGTLPGYKKAVW
jgi:ribosomal protein S14